MIAMIVAVSPERVIGVGNKIPWHYTADLRRFRELTQGHTIIMGRKTYESIGKPLPKRRNIVITRSQIEGVECFTSLPAALDTVKGDAWIIGGAQIYKEGMRFCDRIEVTFVPDHIEAQDAVFFPMIDERDFEPGPMEPFETDPRIKHRTYWRRGQMAG